jgi:hypothetical protein
MEPSSMAKTIILKSATNTYSKTNLAYIHETNYKLALYQYSPKFI